MKTLLFKTLACAAVLLPLGQIQAKTFGSFTPNKMFTLELTAKESFKVKPGGARKNSGIPNGVPNFKIGQKVKFKIGSKTQKSPVLPQENYPWVKFMLSTISQLVGI